MLKNNYFHDFLVFVDNYTHIETKIRGQVKEQAVPLSPPPRRSAPGLNHVWMVKSQSNSCLIILLKNDEKEF